MPIPLTQGGKTESPTYRLVCSGTTAHAEACRITFDPAKGELGKAIAGVWRGLGVECQEAADREKVWRTAGVRIKSSFTHRHVLLLHSWSPPSTLMMSSLYTHESLSADLLKNHLTVSYAELVEFFFRTHDPTQVSHSFSTKPLIVHVVSCAHALSEPRTILFLRYHIALLPAPHLQMNGQGPDRGTQYRSAIFYHSPEQKEIAEKVREEIKSKHPLVIQGGKIATEITEAGKWWSAEGGSLVDGRVSASRGASLPGYVG